MAIVEIVKFFVLVITTQVTQVVSTESDRCISLLNDSECNKPRTGRCRQPLQRNNTLCGVSQDHADLNCTVRRAQYNSVCPNTDSDSLTWTWYNVCLFHPRPIKPPEEFISEYNCRVTWQFGPVNCTSKINPMDTFLSTCNFIFYRCKYGPEQCGQNFHKELEEGGSCPPPADYCPSGNLYSLTDLPYCNSSHFKPIPTDFANLEFVNVRPPDRCVGGLKTEHVIAIVFSVIIIVTAAICACKYLYLFCRPKVRVDDPMFIHLDKHIGLVLADKPEIRNLYDDNDDDSNGEEEAAEMLTSKTPTSSTSSRTSSESGFLEPRSPRSPLPKSSYPDNESTPDATAAALISFPLLHSYQNDSDNRDDQFRPYSLSVSNPTYTSRVSPKCNSSFPSINHAIPSGGVSADFKAAETAVYQNQLGSFTQETYHPTTCSFSGPSTEGCQNTSEHRIPLLVGYVQQSRLNDNLSETSASNFDSGLSRVTEPCSTPNSTTPGYIQKSCNLESNLRETSTGNISSALPPSSCYTESCSGLDSATPGYVQKNYNSESDFSETSTGNFGSTFLPPAACIRPETVSGTDSTTPGYIQKSSNFESNCPETSTGNFDSGLPLAAGNCTETRTGTDTATPGYVQKSSNFESPTSDMPNPIGSCLHSTSDNHQ